MYFELSLDTRLYDAFQVVTLICLGDATLSRHSGIDIAQLNLQARISSNHSGDVSSTPSKVVYSKKLAHHKTSIHIVSIIGYR